MKRSLALAAPLVTALFATAPARADTFDCFPLCAPQTTAAATKVNLCDQKVVRDVAAIDHQMKPLKDLYGIAMNPTGFAIKQVSEHVVHIPAWVGYAMNPQGAIRAKVMERVRYEVKKQVGLENSCASKPQADAKPAIAGDEAVTAAEDRI